LIPLTDAADALLAAAIRLRDGVRLPSFNAEDVLRLTDAVEDALKYCRGVARKAAESEFAEEWELDD
jgi:transposase